MVFDTLQLLRPVLAFILLVGVPFGMLKLERWRMGPDKALPSDRLAVFWGCVIMATASVFIKEIPMATALSVPWLIYVSIEALAALVRVARSKPMLASWSQASYLGASIFLPIGAVWLLFSNLQWAPFGFRNPVVLLTAIHFHVAGFLGLIIVAEIGAKLVKVSTQHQLFYRLGALGALLGMPLVAIGITFPGTIEVLGVTVYAGSMILLAWLAWREANQLFGSRQMVGKFSVGSLGVSMVLALWYRLAPGFGLHSPSIPAMAMTHGLLNVFAFTVPCLWALAGLPAKTRDSETLVSEPVVETKKQKRKKKLASKS